MRIKLFLLTLSCITALSFSPVELYAQDAGEESGSGLSLGVGGAIGTTPYKSYDAQWMVFPVISYENKYVYIRGLEAGVKILNREMFELSAFVGYDPTSFDASDANDWQMGRLKDRRSSAVAGLGAQVHTPYGSLQVKIAGDILGNSNGFSAKAGYNYTFFISKLALTLDAGTYWASDKYNDYYYGISRSESFRSGLAAYNANSGFSPYLGAMANVDITDHWGVFCGGEVVFLNREITKSPMVNKSQTMGLTMGVTYSF